MFIFLVFSWVCERRYYRQNIVVFWYAVRYKLEQINSDMIIGHLFAVCFYSRSISMLS